MVGKVVEISSCTPFSPMEEIVVGTSFILSSGNSNTNVSLVITFGPIDSGAIVVIIDASEVDNDGDGDDEPTTAGEAAISSDSIEARVVTFSSTISTTDGFSLDFSTSLETVVVTG